MLSWFIIHPCLFLSPPILIFLLVSWLEITEYTDNSQIYIHAQSLSQCSDVGWSAYVTRFVVLPIISNWPCWKVESSKSPLHAASPSQGWQTTHPLIRWSGTKSITQKSLHHVEVTLGQRRPKRLILAAHYIRGVLPASYFWRLIWLLIYPYLL